MRIIFLILGALFSNLVFAQQYSGVNVNRIKGRMYKAATEFEPYHQFSAGVNLMRSLNYSGDVAWGLKPDKGYAYRVVIPGMQFEYAYNWQRIAIHLRYMYEKVEEQVNTPQLQERRRVDQSTYGLGVHYKWLYRDKLRLYSGITLGSSVQKTRENVVHNGYQSTSRAGYGSIQLIALGINYKFSNFGLFGEAGYGKKGLVYAGVFYSI
ncbi:MAG: hypothetical protein EOP54_04180 [Sphingobacteriales bacterium]|nr:MAG: hypothetical protein EOP54_04180 [Sphingobacteriales bacterium]